MTDLPDTKLLTPEDFAGGVWLNANEWGGSAEMFVEATLSNGKVLTLDLQDTGDRNVGLTDL